MLGVIRAWFDLGLALWQHRERKGVGEMATERVSVRLPEDLARALRRKAKAEKKTLTQVLVEAARAGLAGEAALWAKAALIGVAHAATGGDWEKTWAWVRRFEEAARKGEGTGAEAE